MVSQFERLLQREREKAIFTPEGVLKEEYRGGSPPSSEVGDGGAAAREAAERARLQAEIEARQRADAEAQRQAEQKRQAGLERQRQADIKQQAIVTSRKPTLSTSGTPIRDIEFGKTYAAYQRRLQEEARLKGRNLYASEREKIAGEFSEEPIVTKTDIKTKYYPDVSVDSKVDTRTYGTTYVPPTFKMGDIYPPKYSLPSLNLIDGTKQPTIKDLAPSPPTTKVYPPGTIYKFQTDIFKVKGKEKYIPITETYTVGKDWTSRVATTKEKETLKEYQQAESFKELALSEPPSKTKRLISEQYGKYKDLASEELISQETIQDIISKDTGKGKYQQQVNQFLGGAVYGTIGTKGALFRTGAIYGATAGLGFAVGGVTSGATAGTTALFGAKAGKITATTLKLGTYVGGGYFTGKYLYGRAEEISKAPTYFEKGKITGRTGADIGSAIYGFKTGTKLWDITYGKIRTRGKIDIPEEQIIMKGALEGERYPSKPTIQHWKEFQTNSQRLVRQLKGYTGEGEFISPSQVQKLPIKVEPKLYHTTGEVFWDGKSFVVEGMGDSEFTGLFGGSGVSPTFARITGSSSKTKWIPSWRDLTSIHKPGTATVIPTKFVKGTSGKPGEAFVPGAVGYPKTEIQAILSEGSRASLISQDFRYTWEGVRIPLDVFRADAGVSAGGVSGTSGTPIIKYSSYTPPAIIDITTGIVSAYQPSSTTTPPPVTSVTPSYSSVSSSIPSSSIVSSSIVSSSAPVSSSRIISSSKARVSKSYTPSYSSVSSVLSSAKSSSKLRSSGLYSSIFKPSRYRYSYSYKKPPITTTILKQPPIKLKKQARGFEVLGRRFGKFKIVGVSRTEVGAFRLGKRFVGKTLGATFKVPKSKITKLPGFRTKITKQGILFIEPRRRRLKKRGREVQEIQMFKQAKKKRRKKK